MPSEPPSDAELQQAAERLVTEVAADPRCSRVTDVLVVRRGRTLVPSTTDAGRPRDLFSVTKTVLALLAGLAAGDQLVRTDTELDHYLPELAGPAVRGRTVAHLLTMQRGAETAGRFDLDGVAVSGDSWAAVFAEAPEVEAPGAGFRYDNGASQLLAEVLHRATGDLAAYAGRRLLGPLGITEWSWLRDPTGTPAGPGHLSLTATDLARIGKLLCADGRWEDEEVLHPAWVRAMRTPTSSGGPPELRPYGRGLWLEDDEVCFGAGWAGQLLLCRPRDGLVVVTQSDPVFDYGPPARDALPPDWRAPLDLVREHVLSGEGRASQRALERPLTHTTPRRGTMAG